MKKALCFLAAALVASTASAHPGALGHTHGGFLAGFVHPFTGIDHLAAMLAIGLWSALAVRPLWVAPTAFVSVLAVGALCGFTGLAVPAVQPMIAASVLVLGLLVFTRARMPDAAAALLAGVFAFFHGAAHGAELAEGARFAALAGMLLASALLHVAGMGLAQVTRRPWLPALAGFSIALVGATLLLQAA